ncbi:hypothetical protein G7048_15700 [Diaphorobacter sp. HDW4B]|uniref:hypothetical protein n=1 Tax=Diaphorobacter sp. HDW4B TaxID=2714925 RepID=UPI00140C9DB5|nr:hypothetical protein [Diaphorobacter sp. HDW4B]QIL71672.1 hypothetical protein G7048_15700 [Diaphorobacter sp. HDW4B]
MIAGSLEIQMLANLAELKKQMDQGVGIVKGASEQMQKAAELAGKALGLIGASLSVAAFTGFIKKAIDAADALDEMSGRVGVSTKELSQLQLAYKQAGIGNDGMASSLAKLSKEMSDGNVGLRALGVNAKNADGSLRSTTSVLLEVADKFTTLEDGASKTALAMEIFGKSGAEMVPLLNSGSEGIRELTEMSEKLGLVIEDDVGAKAGQFNDTLELLQLGVQGVGTRVAGQLLPTLNNLTGSFLETMTQGERLARVSDIIASAMKGLYSIGIGVVEVFNTVGKTLAAALAQAMAVLKGNFGEAGRIGAAWREDVTSGWQASGAAISAAWSEESNATVAAAANIVKTNRDLLGEQKAREEAAKKSSDASAKAAAEHAKAVADAVKQMDGLLAEGGGLSKDFQKSWDALNLAYKEGGKSLEDLQKAQKVLLDQQPAMKKAAEEETAAWKAYRDERAKVAEEIHKSAEELEKGNKDLNDEIELIGKSKKEQEVILRLRREALILKKQEEAQALESQPALKIHDEMRLVALKDEIEQLQKRNELMGMKDVAEQSAAVQEKIRADTSQTLQQIEDWFTSSFLDMINNGKDGWKAMCQSLKNSFLTLVAKEIYAALAKPFVVQLVGSLLGVSGGNGLMGMLGGGSGGTGSNLLSTGSNLYSAYNTGSSLYTVGSQYFAGSMSAANAGGTLFANSVGGGLDALLATNSAYGTAAGSSMSMGAFSGAGIGAAIVMAAAYLGGMFKSEKQVAAGLTGELGGDVYGYQLMREGGSLFSGPSYKYIIAEKELEKARAEIEELKKNPELETDGNLTYRMKYLRERVEMLEGKYGSSIAASQGPIDILQQSYSAIRESVALQADSLGLDGDAVRKMKTALGLDEIHPDTGGLGIELSGLSEEEAAEKVKAVLEKANEDLARSVLGSMQEVTREVTRTYAEVVPVHDEDGNVYENRIWHDVTETVTTMEWVMSEYVREGETAVAALNRISGSLVGVNQVFELLGADLLSASLASGDWASKLIEAMGGIENLNTAAASYYDRYYSDDEKRARQISTANAGMESLGLDLRVEDDDAMQKYRDLVDGAIAAKDEVLLAALLKFAEQFGLGVDAVVAATQAHLDELAAAKEAADAARENALSSMGLSIDSLVDGFIGEINEGRGAQAGAWLADQIAVGFEQAIYGQAVGIIMTSIIDGVITPVVTAAMTGSSVSAAVSNAAIDNMIANATAAAAALGALLSSPEFKGAMEEVKKVVTNLGNSIGATIPAMSTYKSAVVSSAPAYTNTASAVDSAASAAQKLAETMKTLGDSIVEEIKRIRGLVVGDGADGFALAQSNFAIATAQARAGDEDAAKALPGLSRDLLELAKSNVRTSSDLKYYQAQTAASLQATVEAMAVQFGFQVPAFADGGFHAGGWALVGERGPELAYMPPSHVYTAPQTRELMSSGGGGSDGWQYLASELAQTNERLRNVERHVRRSADAAEDSQRNGMPVVNMDKSKLKVEVAA